jgi:MOSC domain-containing protein YiiM
MTKSPIRHQVVGVQVGKARPLQVSDERWEMSGIRKHAVAGRVAVRALGLVGDEQADLTVHGGLSKAVYAYPLEHYEFWRTSQRALGLPSELPCGSLGENLTVTGVLEDSLYVGDTLHFPDCVLRVTQPRAPCHKFIAVMEDPKAAVKMMQSRFSGYYLAVDTPGSLSVGEFFEVRPGPREVPLMALFRAQKSTNRGRAG